MNWHEEIAHPCNIASHSRHEKPNLHIIYNNSHIATTSNISKITRESNHQQHQEQQ
jgi:hypothetical protein